MTGYLVISFSSSVSILLITSGLFFKSPRNFSMETPSGLSLSILRHPVQNSQFHFEWYMSSEKCFLYFYLCSLSFIYKDDMIIKSCSTFKSQMSNIGSLKRKENYKVQLIRKWSGLRLHPKYI